MTEQDYMAELARKGYPAPTTKTWEAGRLNADHTHDHALFLYILEGRMTIEMEGAAHDLRPGDICEVPGGLPHSEQAGAEGVRFLVAAR